MRYGWIPDVPDMRDKLFSRWEAPRAIPNTVDLSNLTGPVLDQGDLGSCTANAIASALMYPQILANYMKKSGLESSTIITPSRLFIYYNERVYEHTTASDAGASIRNGIKSVVWRGVCPELEWPYDITKFAVAPPKQDYTDAAKFKVSQYLRVQNARAIVTSLAAGFPVVVGISVYSSFESDEVAQSGIVPMPTKHDRLLGGHAVLATGYKNSNSGERLIICKNSWGTSWGQQGYFTLPFNYLDDSELADDFWSIRAEVTS
jgi:C1A family cysteine protease